MRRIYSSPPDITEDEISEVVEAIKSGWITTAARTKKFEQKIAEYTGTSRAACLNSATAAMFLTLLLLGIKKGDEVITTPYTYTASAAVIKLCGAKIVFADTAPGSLEMDYSKLADKINERTKAIIPVDVAGKMCDYKKLYEIVEAKKHLFKAKCEIQEKFNRIIILADAAHSLGAERNGQKSGQAADFTCFSFHAVKNLTTAEGGAVVWCTKDNIDDDWLYKQFMLYSLHGQSKDAFQKSQLGEWEYDIVFTGFKCNMTDILAAIGLKQLERYPKMLQRRREIICAYDAAFKPLGLMPCEHYGDDFSSSGHLYLLRIPGINSEQRNCLISKLAATGIAANVHYKPLPMFTAYKNMGFCIDDFPNAYAFYENEITLPLHTKLSDEDVEYVIESLINILKEYI